MLTDIAKATGEVGLGLHMGKAKLLSNGIGRMTTSRKVTVLNKEVEVLPPWKATAYLGKDLCLSNVHDAEIESRVRKAWAKFNKFKSELCDTAFSLNLRLRLFNAVVTQTMMYGSAAWAMTCERETRLNTTQRKMLRSIIGTKRAPDEEEDDGIENFVTWMKRSTAKVRDAMIEADIPDWVELQRQKKWTFTGRTLARADKSWTELMITSNIQGKRRDGRPLKRWSDDIVAFLTGMYSPDCAKTDSWTTVSECKAVWVMHAYDFARQHWH